MVQGDDHAAQRHEASHGSSAINSIFLIIHLLKVKMNYLVGC